MIKQTAKHYGVPEEEVRQSIQEIIDEAWRTTDPEAKRLQQQAFPAGKPTPEEFVRVLSNMIVLHQ